MKLKHLIIILVAASTSGCVSSPNTPPAEPTWFPLGASFRVCRPGTILGGDTDKIGPTYDDIIAEVHHKGHRLEVQKTTLSVVPDPRWFKGSQLPKTVHAVPLSDQGALLTFQIQPTTNGLLRFVLTLEAKERDVWREVEHRWTNVTPFLFAFFADGKAVRPKEPDSWSKIGGINSMIKLVDKGKTHIWNLTVDPKTILALLPNTKFDELSIVAAFSESQHQLPGMSDIERNLKFYSKLEGPQVVIRSNPVKMTFDGKTWSVKQNR